MRRGCKEGERARAVEGVELALRPLRFVLMSREGRREDVGVGEWACEEAIDGRGEEMVDIFVAD